MRDTARERPAGTFAVNLFSADESRILPALTLDLGQKTAISAGSNNVGQRELWPWLAVLALLILVLEWWVHHRGPRLPKLKPK